MSCLVSESWFVLNFLVKNLIFFMFGFLCVGNCMSWLVWLVNHGLF